MQNETIKEIRGNSIHSKWWRRPLETLFPDKKFDGQFQNPGSEEVFDFDDRVMIKSKPFEFIKKEIAYYPPVIKSELYTIFIPGLGQVKKTSSKRSRRYADRLQIGIVNLNNGSFLKNNPILSKINPFLDWIDATIHRLGLSGSPLIKNCSTLILRAIEEKQEINFSADSHGTILLGRALSSAKKRFIFKNTFWFNFKGRRNWEKKWEESSHRFVTIFAFGNGYRKWVRGPKYVMIYINGDPLVSKVGINLEKVQKIDRNDIKFIVFEPLFSSGDFEAHNMMFTIELLRESFVKNNIEIGDFVSLYNALDRNKLQLFTTSESKDKLFPWPDDMKDYQWSNDKLNFLRES